MAAQDLALRVLLSCSDQASGKLKGFGSTLVSLAGDGGPLLKVLGGIGLAGLGVAVTSVKMAGDFDQAMRKNVALAGLSKDKMGEWGNAILKMAPEVGKAPVDLANGLYFVLSQGVPAAQALDTVRYAAQLAAIGMTDSATTAIALTKTMKGFGMSSKQAADLITVAVAQGSMTMDQYSKVIGKLALDSKTAGRSAYETNAALAVLSYTFKSAATASTGLSQLYTQMDIKTSTLAAKFDKLHTTTSKYSGTVMVLKDVHGQMVHVLEKVHGTSKLVSASFDEHAFKAMDLAHQIAYLNKITGGNREELLKMFNGSKQALQAFEALSSGSKDYATNLQKLKDASKGAGATQSAWEVTQGGFNQSMNRVNAAIQVMFIKIGQNLLPIVTQFMGILIPVITWLGNFADAFMHNETAMAIFKGVLVGFVVVVLGILIPAFWAWATAAAGAALATIALNAPLLIIAAIVAVVVAGIILAIQHWGQIMDWISGKAAITADKVALAHIKMRISADDNQKKQAEKSIANLEKERQGILTKLKQAHSEQERETLMHQLRMVDAQIDGQNKRIAAIDADKQKQIEKQKEMQAKLQEDQKNWFVRLLDDILGFFGMVFGAIGGFFGNIFSKIGQFKDSVIQKFKDIWNGIVDGAKSILNGLGTTIVNLVKIPVNLVIGGINHLIDGYNNLPKFGAPNLGHIPYLASGAENFQGGLAYVHAGEMLTYLPRGSSVTPAHRVSAALRASSGGAGGHTTIINATVTVNAGNANPDQVAQKVHAILSRDLRRSGAIATATSGGRAAS